jgi:hypothetical protein
MPSFSPRHLKLLAGSALTLALASAAPSPSPDAAVAAAAPQDPQSVALLSWIDYLQSIGWPQELRERYAPQFLGVQTTAVANEHGGRTLTFDGSRPGVRATVAVVLDAAGKVVGKPVVQLADVLEAR